MNLTSLLSKRAKPVNVGLIGAGKFGSMFLNQVPFIKGIKVVAIADLDPSKVKANLKALGWSDALIASTHLTEKAKDLTDNPEIEVIIEATGNPLVGLLHAQDAIKAKQHVVMVNVEADVLAGARLAKMAEKANVVYSMAYGDQPALVAEMVDWGRAAGFEIASAGKGTKYLPSFHYVTPANVWEHYGLTPEQANAAGMNPKMFNSFLDGKKSALEMAAIANACELNVPEHGLTFPPCGVDDLAQILRAKSEGGVLEMSNQVEVISSLERDGRPVFRDLRWGVYVVLKAPNAYAASCFKQYGLSTDKSGQYAAMYKPFHLIGLELSISVLSAALRGESTGSTKGFHGDVVAVAKRKLKKGEWLDGEGGETVFGKLMPAAHSLEIKGLPIGLAHHVKLKNNVAKDMVVTKDDVELDYNDQAVAFREAMEIEKL